MLCFPSLSATYFSNGPFIIYRLRGWGSEGFFGEGGSGFGTWFSGGRGISRRQETINGGGGGKAGLRVGIEEFWIWFLVGTAGRGISCRQGTLKEGL